ncbi:DeoR family transcriptional regulator [Candidatus Azambacteria bacterium]|nr:DeoR family transcriptional regulator [Candidatus Azambacteria bacterium]
MEDNVFNTELGRKILALTKACFKVSDLIPDLVLREKIKSQVLNVYKSFFSGEVNEEKSRPELLKEIDILDGYLFLGGELKLIKSEYVRALRNGFFVFKSRVILAMNKPPKTFGGAVPERIDSVPPPASKSAKKEAVDSEPRMNDRQKKILEKFKNKESMRLAEISDFFPGISKRTIRRELSLLMDFKKIARTGKGHNSFYDLMRP